MKATDVIHPIPAKILTELGIERKRQLDLYGDQMDNTPCKWSAILGEEYGEVCKETLEFEFAPFSQTPYMHEILLLSLRDELIQTAAVAIAWIECIDKVYPDLADD